jgi:aspartyl-tRNA(Asn)/glutamyl-tRNA(Gln) amidotransferase subunit A
MSRHGAASLSPTMDKLGPMARTAEDCGLVLAATAGADAHDPSARARGFSLRSQAAGRRYRLGILRGTLHRTQAEVGRNFEQSLEVMSEVADLVGELELPDYPYDALACAVLDAESASAEPAWSRGREYLRALRARRPAAAALDRLLAQVDAVIAPTLPTVAWPVNTPPDQVYPEYSGGTSMAGAANLCGAPGLFLPNGWGEAGLPTSLQFTGRAGAEAVLLQLGMEFQARTNFHRRRPPGL